MNGPVPLGGNVGMLDGHVNWVSFTVMLPRCGTAAIRITIIEINFFKGRGVALRRPRTPLRAVPTPNHSPLSEGASVPLSSVAFAKADLSRQSLARSVLECGAWRGTGLTPLSHLRRWIWHVERWMFSLPKVACALTPWNKHFVRVGSRCAPSLHGWLIKGMPWVAQAARLSRSATRRPERATTSCFRANQPLMSQPCFFSGRILALPPRAGRKKGI